MVEDREHDASAASGRGDGTVEADSATGPPAAPDSAQFRVDDATGVVVHVSGELDAKSGAQLRTILSEAFAAENPSVAVDMSELVFIDSVGLSVLVAAHNRGASQGVPFEIRNVPARCLRLFEITGLIDVLDLR